MNVNRTLLMLIVVCLVAVFLGCTEGQAEKKSDTGADQAPPQLASSAADTLSDSAEARSDGKGPKIVFAETTYDFGKKMSGVDLTNTFTFKNEGDSTLIIENVKGG